MVDKVDQTRRLLINTGWGSAIVKRPCAKCDLCAISGHDNTRATRRLGPESDF